MAESEELARQKIKETEGDAVLSEGEMEVHEITDVVRTLGDH